MDENYDCLEGKKGSQHDEQIDDGIPEIPIVGYHHSTISMNLHKCMLSVPAFVNGTFLQARCTVAVWQRLLPAPAGEIVNADYPENNNFGI
jgi:hypothetical protein